jgi:Putative phage tail protein
VASLVLGVAGAAIGSTFGPWGAMIGWTLGSAAGNALFPNKPPSTLHDLHIQGSSYGVALKTFWGKVRLSGAVIWQTDLQEHQSGGKGGKGSGGAQSSFLVSFDVALCETQVAKLSRFWAGGRLNYDANQSGGANIPFTFYDGNAAQLTDPTEEAVEGVGNVPAYRGISRVVFHDWDMTQFGNTLPQLSFEVLSSAGTIPWRVSSFNAVNGLDVSTPYDMQGTYDGETGIITIGQYVGTGTYRKQQYMVDGTPVGSLIGPTGLDSLAGITPTTTEGGVNNLQSGFFYHAGGSLIPNVGWYTEQTLVATNPSPSQFTAIHGIYQNGFIYNIVGNPVSIVYRWIAPDGIPTGIIDGTYSLGVVSSQTDVYISASDDGHIWVSDNTGAGNALWKFNEDLTLVHVWDFTALPAVWSGKFSKVFYKGMVCVNAQKDGIRQAVVYKCNPDFTFTLVGNIPQTDGPEIRLFNGLVLSEDGIISLDAPDGSVFLSEVVGDLCIKAGIASYNVGQLSAIKVDGFVIENTTTCRAAIEMLMPVYFFDAVESDGVTKFVVRGAEPDPATDTFLEEDLAAHMDHDGLPSVLTCVYTPDADLPSTINFSYLNKDGDYQVNTQTWQRMTGGSRDTRTINVPIVLTDSHAKKIVDSWGWNSYTERATYTWYSSRKYVAWEPTDVRFVQGKKLRIVKKTEGATGVIKWEGVLSRGANFTQAGAGGAAKDPGQILSTPQKTQLVLLDLPLLQDADAPNGIYAAVAGAKNSSFAGAAVSKSFDGTSYSNIAIATRANTIGTATTRLGDYTGPNVFDEGNVVRVAIGKGDGTLLSATQTGVLNGDNEGVLGSEIFQWKNAALISTGVYDLSGLLRGRRGTEWTQSSHIVGETFVAFNPAPLNPPALISEIGSTEYYKAVTLGQTLASATAQTFANIGNALKPYSPTYLGGGCDASGNVTGNFLRRTRIGGGGKLVGPKPLSEATESYIVQITDASYTLVARIIPVTTQTFSYSGAQAITDFGALQHDIFWTVGQIGAVSIGALSRGRCPSTGSSNTIPLAPITPYSFNPIITPPQPPGGGSPVDVVMTYPSFGQQPFPALIGQRKVCQFTTGVIGPGTVGHIDNFEFGSNTTGRHCFIATDTGGLNKVPRSESYGTTATSFIGAVTGGAILSSSTTYYYIFDFVQADGTLSGVAGTNASSVLNLQVIP